MTLYGGRDDAVRPVLQIALVREVFANVAYMIQIAWNL